MNLTQFKDRLSHIWWSHMKRANHKILGWLRQSHTGGETETRAVAVGAPKVMRAVTSWAATRCFFGLLRRNSSRMFLASFRSRNAVTRQSLAREMASQVWASTSQQGFTATARSLRGRAQRTRTDWDLKGSSEENRPILPIRRVQSCTDTRNWPCIGSAWLRFSGLCPFDLPVHPS